MDSRDPRENRPRRSEADTPAEGGADDASVAAQPIGSFGLGTQKKDPDATISYRPSKSGIALALGTAGVVVIHDVDQFVHELTDNALVDSADVEPVRQQITARMGPSHAQALARELVRLGRLTAYQAAAVLQGKTKGLLIGNYLVLDKLGAGSMGMVFKARHRLLNRIVALKLLPPSLARDPAAVQRFEREAKAAATLSHPNVVAVIDADEYRGLHFLVMEYVEGRDLARLVREDGPLSVSQAIDCLAQAARGLKAAFEASVVHRDIKPSNLLLQPGGTVKILDMGLARLDAVGSPFGAKEPDASLTQSNVILGTIDYMSPEQASNPRNADHRSDIYSLGCTLHYLLTGRPPFSGETLIERLIAHREQPIPSLSNGRPDVSPAVDDLLKRLLAKSPDDRFSSLDELITALDASRESTATNTGVRPPRPLDADARKSGGRRRSTIAAAIVSGIAATLGLVATAVYVGWPKSGQSREKAPRAAVAPLVAKNDTVSVPEPATRPKRVPLPPADPPKREPESIRAADSAAAAAVKPALSVEPVGLVRELKGHKRRANAVAVSGDGLLALSGGQDRTVRLWTIASGDELRRLEHDGPVYAVALAADGQTGASGSADKTVRLWDFRSERDVGMRRLDGHTAAVFAVMFAPGDQFVLSAGADRTVRVWDVATGQASGSPLIHESAIVALATTGGHGILAGCDDGTMWLWDLKSRQRVRKLKAPGPILCVAGSPLGHRALSGHADGVLVLWDLDLGAEIGRLIGHSDLVRCAAFLPDGQRALAGRQLGNLILWDIESQRELRRLAPSATASEHGGQLGLAPLTDGLHALSADTDGTVRLWRLAEDAPIGTSSKRAAP
jgi:eukaryotic-like serine/threonine-protein kinase